MFYVVSTIFWLLAQPSSLMLLALGLGLLLAATKRFGRGGRRLAWAGIAGLAVGGFSPLANLVILPLEQRFPVPAIEPGARSFAGILVLGGAEVGHIGAARGQLSLNEAAERVTEGLRLALLLPSARLVFTGGAARIFLENTTGAPLVSAFWRTAGIPAERIVLEDKSLTTWENALYSHAMLRPQSGEQFLLVTSANHMPRAMAAFRKAGFAVVAYPVDFRTSGAGDLRRPFDAFPKGLRRLDDATREWIGLLAYRLTGRSSDLFPAP